MCSIATTSTSEWRLLKRIYLWSFVLRVLLGLLAWWLSHSLAPDYALVQDAVAYEHDGAQIARDWLEGQPNDLLAEMKEGGQAWGMLFAVASVYWVTGGWGGISILMIVYCALASFAPVLTYQISRRLGASSGAAKIGAFLVVCSPCFILFSAIAKEGMIYVLLNGIVLSVISLQARWKWGDLAVLTFSLLALFSLRFYLAIIIFPVAALSLLFGRVRTTVTGPIKYSMLIVRQMWIASAFVCLLGSLGFLANVRGFLPNPSEALERIQIMRSDLANEQSGYLPGADVSTPGNAIYLLPIGLTYFLAAPFPWQMGSVRQNAAIPETLFWCLLYPLIACGMWSCLRSNLQGCISPMLLIVLICCFYAILIGNLGTAYRMRSQAWLLMAPFAGRGWDVLCDYFKNPTGE